MQQEVAAGDAGEFSWQAHSVRGAIAGTLKGKGCRIESEKLEGRRVYRIAERSAG